MKKDISKILQKNKKQLSELWLNNQLADATLREDLMSNEELRIQSDELLDAILKNISDSNMLSADTQEFDDVYEILAGISISRARQGFTPRETTVYIFSLKDAMLQVLQDELGNEPMMLFEASQKVSKLIDSFGIITFETYLKGREEVILRQTNEITEISTPVIRVWDGILALPIIGTLDSSRTQVVMESLLKEIVETGSNIAILDISGVPAVDSLVAQHLIKTVSATRLMGADCVISGIRPEIAQTIVHLGIDLSSIVTKSSLASALRHALQSMQLEIRKKNTANTNTIK